MVRLALLKNHQEVILYNEIPAKIEIFKKFFLQKAGIIDIFYIPTPYNCSNSYLLLKIKSFHISRLYRQIVSS